MSTYEVKFRFQGRNSMVQVRANDAAQARQLVIAQYGGQATVIESRRVR